jgi:hypothetical protein
MTAHRIDAAYITALANKKGYLPWGGFRTLDGSDVANWLRERGFEVVRNYDAKTHGIAITACGIAVSTSGYVSRATQSQQP